MEVIQTSREFPIWTQAVSDERHGSQQQTQLSP